MVTQKSRTPKTALWGGIITLGLLVFSYILSVREQCPNNYTQQQVDASHCVVGANIGLGIALMASVLSAAVTTLAVIVLAFIERRRR